MERLAGCLLGLNLLALVGIAVWFRCWQLGTIPGLNGDEAWYGIEAMHWLQGAPIQWRTPTNNPLNLLYFGPLVLLHWLAEPSPSLVRGAALLSGLMALPAAFCLGRRVFGLRHGTMAAAIVAILPVNIAYSRFGWDASQTLLVVLPVVYLPLAAMADPRHRQRWLIAAAVCLLAAMWIHPTNIFAMPLVALPAVWMWRIELLTTWRQQAASRRLALLAVATGGLALMAMLAHRWLLAILERLVNPAEFGRFLIHYHRLFSGTTVYRYIAGSTSAVNSWTSLPHWDLLLSDVVAWIVSAAILLTIWRQARLDWKSRDACLLASWGAMLLGFYLVAGADAIQPHYERYGICLIAPAIVLAARAIEIHCRQTVVSHPRNYVGALAVAWLLLLGFGTHYFAFIYRTGGRSHDTFRTNVIEPKAAALAHIVAASPAQGPIWIVSSEYWNHRPLAYLASADHRLQVGSPDSLDQLPGRDTVLAEGRVWHVEFADSQAYRDTMERLRAEDRNYEESPIRDFAGRPVLMLVRPAGKRSHAQQQPGPDAVLATMSAAGAE